MSAPALGVIILLAFAMPPRVAGAAIFAVNSTDDVADANPGDGVCATTEGVCTLRAAIQEGNALAGMDTINVPANTYLINIADAGSDEDTAATGDLDILDDLTITGSTAGPTIVGVSVGVKVDRVFDVIGPATVTMTHLIIANGFSKGGDGGGIRNDGDLTLSQVAMHHNHADGNGGAIANFNSGTLHLINVTLAINTAGGKGGGISNFNSGKVQLTNVTISGNSAPTGGGIHNDVQNGINIVNSIVANNTMGGNSGNCAGPELNSHGFNLENIDTCLFAAQGDLPNTDPMLGVLQIENGGYTYTQKLLSGSPAIDRGDNTNCPDIDQRGFPRPIDGDGIGSARCDIGAFEVQPNVTPTTTPIPTPTVTLTPPSTSTATVTSTPLPTNTAPPTPTNSPTKVNTPTSTELPALPTPTPTPTSRTPTHSPTLTGSPTATGPTLSPTWTLSPTATPRGPVIVLGIAAGRPGDEVEFAARLDAPADEVAAVQSDISFDPLNIPIAAVRGIPECRVGTTLHQLPSFTLIKTAGCSSPFCTCGDVSCTALRAVLYPPLPPNPIGPIPDGSILYTCKVKIAPNAVPGEYPLTASRVAMSDPLGLPVSGASGTDGVIVVLEPLTPTPTPTDTPPPTPSDTPTSPPSPTAAPTDTPTATFTPTATDRPTSTPAPTASPTHTMVPCVGNCDGSGGITADDLLTMVDIALGNAPLNACSDGDADHGGAIVIDEIVRAVNNALGGCGT